MCHNLLRLAQVSRQTDDRDSNKEERTLPCRENDLWPSLEILGNVSAEDTFTGKIDFSLRLMQSVVTVMSLERKSWSLNVKGYKNKMLIFQPCVKIVCRGPMQEAARCYSAPYNKGEKVRKGSFTSKHWQGKTIFKFNTSTLLFLFVLRQATFLSLWVDGTHMLGHENSFKKQLVAG